MGMDNLFALGDKVGELLVTRGETVAVGESSAGGLISAALLSVPGASKFYLGGAVVYTPASFRALTNIDRAMMRAKKIRSSTEDYAALLAEDARANHEADWGISETGAAGPDGNPYGDAAGHTCVAIAGPLPVRRTLETGSADRRANMFAFAGECLSLFIDVLETETSP